MMRTMLGTMGMKRISRSSSQPASFDAENPGATCNCVPADKNGIRLSICAEYQFSPRTSRQGSPSSSPISRADTSPLCRSAAADW